MLVSFSPSSGCFRVKGKFWLLHNDFIFELDIKEAHVLVIHMLIIINSFYISIHPSSVHPSIHSYFPLTYSLIHSSKGDTLFRSTGNTKINNTKYFT